jgi:hypothetical protein
MRVIDCCSLCSGYPQVARAIFTLLRIQSHYQTHVWVKYQFVTSRTAKQCCKRWFNQFDPTLKTQETIRSVGRRNYNRETEAAWKLMVADCGQFAGKKSRSCEESTVCRTEGSNRDEAAQEENIESKTSEF